MNFGLAGVSSLYLVFTHLLKEVYLNLEI